MALYPIQEKFYDEVQAGPVEHRDDCGKPGINGGYFDDASLKFGVNCYGVRPKADPKRIVYVDETSDEYIKQQPFERTHYTHHSAVNHKLAAIKDRLKRDHVNPTPFSQHRWGQNSKRDSRYIMEKSYGTATVADNVRPVATPPSNHGGATGGAGGGNGCQSSNYGCCKDGFTTKSDVKGSNCPGWNKKCGSRGGSASKDTYIISEETIL